MDKRRILIVDQNRELRTLLEEVLCELGHDVIVADSPTIASERNDLEKFDLVISDLSDDAEGGVQILSELQRKQLLVPVVISSEEAHHTGIVKAFRMGVANFVRRPYNRDELQQIVEKTLSYKLRFVEDLKILPYARERVEFELPSDLALMNGVLHYLMERVTRLGLIQPSRSNLFIALDEAFVNAVKHGNKSDVNKLVRITAELSAREARFTIEDEGDGFDRTKVPDPRDSANIFKTSGRGVLLINNIMDEVEYNERGNRVTMVKRAEATIESEIVEQHDANIKEEIVEQELAARETAEHNSVEPQSAGREKS